MGKQALVLMDLQNGIIDRINSAGGDCTDYLARAAQTAAAARAAGVPIIYVVMSFRKGHPELSTRNATLAKLKAMGNWAEGDKALEIHPAVAAQFDKGDIVCTKRRVSAFTGSDLDVVLRALEVDTLILAGIATSGVVLSTFRQAADLDFIVTALSDLCLDPDPDTQRFLLDKIFQRQGKVISSSEWMDDLDKKP